MSAAADLPIPTPPVRPKAFIPGERLQGPKRTVPLWAPLMK
jgi:hypothetical protein